MKKSKILLSILSIPACLVVTTPLVMLTSCEETEKDVNLLVTGRDEHYKTYTIDGILKTKRAFTIKLEFFDGYKLNPETTKITCGNKEMIIEEDYKIINTNTISFISSKVTDSNLVIDVYSAPAMTNANGEWDETQTTGVVQGVGLWIAVGEKIEAKALKVLITKGDGQEYPVEIGTAEGQARVMYGWMGEQKDITESFVASGLTITEDMIYKDPDTSKAKITQIPLWISVTDVKTISEMVMTYACRKSTSITINEPEGVESYKVGNQYTFDSEVPEAEFKGVIWSIASGSEYATIDPDDGILDATAAGSVTIKATSKYDDSVYKELTITIVE